MRRELRRGGVMLIALTIALPALGSEPIGRLFFTPERRVALDRARQFNIEEQRVTQQNILTVDGMVTRSSGRTTAWVNGIAIPEGGQAGISATPNQARASVRVRPSNENSTTVTVGTSINRTTGEPLDPLGGGRVSRTESAPTR